LSWNVGKKLPLLSA